MTHINEYSHGNPKDSNRQIVLAKIPLLILITGMVVLAALRVTAQREPTPKVYKLPDAIVGVPYVYKFATPSTTATGDIAVKLEWTAPDDNLPHGLRLDKAGVLSGTPTTASETPYRFTVQVVNTEIGSRPRATQRFSITVSGLDIAVGGLSVEPPSAEERDRERRRAAEEHKFVLATSTSDEETIALTEQEDTDHQVGGVDKDTLRIIDADRLVASTVGIDTAASAKFKVGDYCVVHLIKWKALNAEGKSDPAKETWGLLERVKQGNTEVWERRLNAKDKEGLTYVNRIFGSKRIIVLLINFNTPPTWDVKYKVSITQQTPTPIANVLALAKAIGPRTLELRTEPEKPKTIWGARLMLVNYTASEIVVKVNAVTLDADNSQVEQSKEITKTYTNEGRYHWDVSVGVPATTVRELQFSADASNRVTIAGKDRQNVYGFVNIFLKPTDLSNEGFLTAPHLVFGVPLASKPLHHPFAGIGYGVYKTPIKFNLFAGIVFNRDRVPRTLNVGDSATSSQLESDLRTRWVRKFMFGINFPIKQITDAIKPKSK
jgi:hypothetical protein